MLQIRVSLRCGCSFQVAETIQQLTAVVIIIIIVITLV